MRRWLAPAIVAVAVAAGILVLSAADDRREAVGVAPRDGGSPRLDPYSVRDPVLAGDPLPERFRQVLPRDAIPPVYEPSFVEAAAVAWGDEDIVLGVARGGEARAYPIAFLRQHEMVIDRFVGDPILVSW